jgi:hypothetical protein
MNKSDRRATHWHVALIVCFLLASVMGARAQDVRDAAGDGELVAQVEFTQEQFATLMEKMREVADLVEATEPETAQVLRQAAEQAELAFVEEDMARVAELINEGLLSAAQTNQANVIVELERILEVLRSGVMDPDERQAQLEQWEAQLAALQRVAQEQERLEQETRVRLNAEAIEQAFRDLEQEVQDIIQEQRDLHERTNDWSQQEGSEAISRIAELIQAVDRALAEQARLTAVAERVGLDQLPMLEPFQESLGDLVGDLSSQARELADDEAWQDQLGDVSQSDTMPARAAEVMAQAAAELANAQMAMAQASQAMDNSAAQEAADRQADAESNLADAAEMLRELLDEAAVNTPAGQMAQEQADLARTTAELGNRLEDLAELTGLEPDFGNLGRASREMIDAANDLADQLGDAAGSHQQAAIDQLEEEQYRLAQLERRIEQMQERALTDQATEQEQVADRTDDLAERMEGSQEDSQEATPGSEAARRASDNMRQATDALNRGQNAQGGDEVAEANNEQRDALDELEEAIEELETAIEEEQRQLVEEQLLQMEALLQRILDAQRPVTEATREAYDDRDENDQYDRSTQLRLAELADSEDDIHQQVIELLALIDERGGAVVFTPLLEEVGDTLETIANRLSSLLPDTTTQMMQEDVEATLEGMIAAIELEIEQRRNDETGPPPMPPAPGEGPQPAPPLVSAQTELKLLLLMQRQLLERTRRLAEGEDELSDDERAARQNSLADQQDRISQLAQDLAAQVEAQSAEAGIPESDPPVEE